MLASAQRAFAVDGVIEINQARALAGGVLGDAIRDPPGFPVTIDRSGSYRLTVKSRDGVEYEILNDQSEDMERNDHV